MEYYKQFKSHIASNDFPSYVSLWQEYCLCDEISAEELSLILETIAASPFADAFGCYVEEILPLWQTLPEGEMTTRALLLIFDLETTHSSKLADLAIEFLKKHYGDDPDFQQKLKFVGLRDREHFRGAIRNFQVLHHMNKGSFFLHNGGWGVGEVVDVSPVREQVALEFDYVSGKKELSFKNACKTLMPIPKDHFLARRFGNPDELEKLAREQPVEVIRMLLADLGPKTASDIKDELCDLVIPEEEWSKWWQNTRAKLKKDTRIQNPQTLKDPFILRLAELSHENRFLEEMEKVKSVEKLIDKVYAFVRDFPASLKVAAVKEKVENVLNQLLLEQNLSASQEMQVLFFLCDIDSAKYGPMQAALLTKMEKWDEVIAEMTIIAQKKRLLIDLKKQHADWPLIYVKALLRVDQNPLRDFILETLQEAKQQTLLEKTLKDLAEEPQTSPQTVLWYIQKLGEAKSEKLPLSSPEDRNCFFEAFFTLLYRLESDPSSKEMIKKMLSYLTAGRYLFVREFLKNTTSAVASEILLLATKCQSLTDQDIKILYSLVAVVHPSLGKTGIDDPDAKEEVIWSTEEGYHKLKNRLQQLATVETVENAREIEAARALGDLRENSEFKFALEKRSRIQNEIKFLSKQLNQMRILTPIDVAVDHISIGTVVKLVNDSGKEIEYIFLGPWDVDPDLHILSAQSKVAELLFGLKKGDSADLPDGRWTVVNIESWFNKKG